VTSRTDIPTPREDCSTSTGNSRALSRYLPLAIAVFGVAHAREPNTISGLKNPESAAVGQDGKTLLVPDVKGGTLTWFPIR
jgi:hypothetical protein